MWKTITIVVLVSQCWVSLTDAISCFQCNSNLDFRCFEMEHIDTNHEFYKPCDQQTLDRPMFCRKMHIMVLMDNGTEHERIVRTCGWKNHTKECYRISEKTHEETVCQCSTDGCNTSSTLTPAFLPVLVIAVSSFFAKFVL